MVIIKTKTMKYGKAGNNGAKRKRQDKRRDIFC